MSEFEKTWREKIHAAVTGLGWADPALTPEGVAAEKPPRPELGDLAFPMFPYARLARRAPAQIAAAVAEELRSSGAEARRAGSKRPAPT